jgi:hypothetical protein
MREAIAHLPDGDYHSEVYADGYDRTLTLKAKLSTYQFSWLLAWAHDTERPRCQSSVAKLPVQEQNRWPDAARPPMVARS